MELSEVKQLTHKIIKINITNKNYHSSYSYITRQIVLSDVSDEEVVRFSLEENSNFIQHQCDDENRNIFYVVIPNKVNSTISLYAHYFPAELYEYEEDKNIYWSFNFQDLLTENPLNDSGHKYPIIETDESTGYRKEAGYKDGSIQLKSILPDSIDGYKNPNYKNFTKTNINDDKDMTQQGYTPLSSRYRKPYKYFNEAPSLNGDPYWSAEEAHGTICKETPYWEIRINRDGLSRLVADTVDGKYYPISVHLGYEYLPTSTHYHQHYYGFEGECPDPNDIYVFEGTNITDVNDGFGSKNNYRIIKRTEPFDDTYSMFVDHECILPINLLECKPEGYITKNKCYDYYTYTAIGNDIPGRAVNLQAGEQYSLRYFIFVPNKVDALVDEIMTADCYLAINGQRIEDEFLEYDKQERNQWVYHEVPFIAQGGGADWLEVIGPHSNPEIEFFLTKIEIEKFVEYRPTLTYNEHGLKVEEATFDNTCTNERKEGSKGVLRIPEVSEENKKWEIRTATNVWEQKTQLPNPQGKVFFILGDDVSLDYDELTSNLYYSHLDDNDYGIKYYPFYIDEEPPKIKIPDRLGNNIDDLIIAITKQYDFESENNPDYGMLEIDEYNYITIPDKYQKTGTYTVHIENYITGEEYDYNYKVKPKRIRDDLEGFEEGDLGQSDVRDEDTNNKLYNLSYDISTGDLNFTYPRTVQFFKARNNHFELSLIDSYDNIITRGSTRVEFIKGRTTFEEALVDAGKRDVQKDGKVYYRKINLSDLELDKDENGNEIATIFHLRIYYTDPCYDEPIIDFKKVWVEPLNLDLRPSINGNYKNSRFISYTQDGTPVYGKDCEGYKQSEYYEDDDASKSDSNEDEEEQVQQRQTEYQNFETHAPLVDDDTHKSYYGGVWGNYPILDKTHFKGTRIVRGGYYIYDVEAEFPLDICVDVVNKFSSGELQPIPIGHYCELSIDDKVIQTTLSDAEGKAHFYIDLNDAPLRKHTIKIECFDRYWEPIKYIYFDLIICEDTTKIRPAVPIAFKHFPYCPGYVKTDDETQCEFTYLTDDNLNLYIPQDDTLLLDFDNSKNHFNFKLSVYRHKPQYKNISKFTNRNSTLIYSKNIYNEQDLLLFISAGLNFDTDCKLERDGIEAQHPSTTSPSETTQIANLRDNIKLHGKTPSVNMLAYFNANEQIIRTNQATTTISPEIMCDLMLYAPIVNLKELNNTTIADLFNFYRKNTLDNPVRYSIVTSSLDGENRYRTHKRTFTVHYMNNVRANNYKMQWDGKNNNEPLYTLNEEGKWIFKSIEIKKTAAYNPNDIRSIDNDNEYIKEGKIEVYQNGQLYHYPPIVYDNGDYVCKVENIIKKEANEKIQLRYVFKDGYHFITDSED